MNELTPQQELQESDDQYFDIRDLLKTLNRYKWGIVSVAILTTVVAILITFSLTPVYRATVTVLIESTANRPIEQVQDVYDPGVGRYEYYGTQYEILKSRDLAKRLVDKMGLTNRPEFTQKSTASKWLDWRKWLPFLPDNSPGVTLTEEETKNQERERTIQRFFNNLEVEPVRGTQLVKLQFDSEDPKLAADVANALAELFIESAFEGRLSITEKANSWLTDKLTTLRDEMQRSEQALQAFREQESLVNVGGERGLAEEELTDNAKRVREARKTRTELASAYGKIKQAGDNPSKLEDIGVLMQQQLVQNSKQSVLIASENVKQLEQRYGEKHPQMVAARARLNAATAAYQQQLMTAARGVQSSYEIAQDTEQSISQLEANARGTIRGLDRKGYQLAALERDVESNRQLYDMFLKRFKESDLTANYESMNARVVDRAVPPLRAYKPAKAKIAILALIGGLILGVLLAGGTALLSDVIQSSEDLEGLTGLPVLGVLPVIDDANEIKQLMNLMHSQPKGTFSEGVRSIRTGVLLSDIDRKKKRLVVTSSVPHEGKTTVAINLAMALGQIENVLLLEGDLRRPAIAKQFGMPKDSPGLTDLLSGTAALQNCIYRHEVGKIDVLPIGLTPPNPAELLASGKFRQLVDMLATRYDRIVIDSAPCHAVSDTYLLAQNCDAMLFLVKADASSRRQVRSAIRHLRHANAPLLGTIINHVDLKRHGHFYGSYYMDYGYYDA